MPSRALIAANCRHPGPTSLASRGQVREGCRGDWRQQTGGTMRAKLTIAFVTTVALAAPVSASAAGTNVFLSGGDLHVEGQTGSGMAGFQVSYQAGPQKWQVLGDGAVASDAT